MCTGLSLKNGKHHYFGRNLDLELDYPVDIVITPRNKKESGSLHCEASFQQEA